MRFSILLPAYKIQFLEYSIQSILDQTFKEFELIILNDYSPHPLKQVVSNFPDSRITYLENETNQGAHNLVTNWNKLLNISKGDYVMIMGDDDVLEKNYLEEFDKLINLNPNCKVFHCRSKIIDEKSKLISFTESWPEHESVFENIWHRLNQKRSQYISDFIFQRKTLIQNNGFYSLPLAWGSDDITAYIAAIGEGITHTNKPLFNYRSNSYSITSTGNNSLKIESDFQYIDWLVSFLKKNKPSNVIEIEFHRLLTKNISKFLKNKLVYTLTKSMKKRRLNNLYYWIFYKPKGLSYKIIFISFIKSFGTN